MGAVAMMDVRYGLQFRDQLGFSQSGTSGALMDFQNFHLDVAIGNVL
jgi:hypothetical protein